MSSDKTSNSQMELYCEDEGLFYMGAQTEWLPAEHFMDINNWDDSLKPSASYYIKQAEEWIASMEEGCKIPKGCITQDMSCTMPKPMNDLDEIKEEAVTNIVPKPTSNKEVGSKTLEPYLSTIETAKPFACSECGKLLSSKMSLKRHLRIHSGEKPFSCSQCGKAFVSKKILTQHLQIHSGEKPFACNQCGKTFSQKSGLDQHLLIHSGEKPFSCIHCGKAFAQRGHLTRHIRIHSGEKPFACGQCGNAFARRSDLRTHFRIHCGEKEKPFACSLCGKTFAEGSNLTRHMRIHSFQVWKGI